MAKIRIKVREIDRMTLGIVNAAEVDEARKERRAAMALDPLKVVGEFVPTPATERFEFNAAYAFQQQEKGSTRDIVDVIAEHLVPLVAPEFSSEEIEVVMLPKEAKIRL